MDFIARLQARESWANLDRTAHNREIVNKRAIVGRKLFAAQVQLFFDIFSIYQSKDRLAPITNGNSLRDNAALY